MAMFTAYFDAAGHPDGTHALVVNGYATSVHRWLKFEPRWNGALADAGIHVPFHMADFMANQGDFVGWRDREIEKQSLLMTLARLVRKTAHHGFAEAVLLEDWKNVNQEYDLDGNHCQPYALAGFYVMDRAVRWNKRTHPDRDLHRFVFENGDKHKGDFIWIIDEIVRRARKDRINLSDVSPIFESKKLAPLQAADLVAWANRGFIRQLLDRGSSLSVADPKNRTLVTDWMRELAKVPSTWGYLDTDKIVKFCGDYGVPKRGETRQWAGVRRVRP